MKTRDLISTILAVALSVIPYAAKASDWADSGKLLATGGVSEVEGAGGGGLTPWALITGYGTRNAVGANVHYTYVHVPDFRLHTAGLSVGLFDRVELSYAKQYFDTAQTGAALGLGEGYTFRQNVFGVKVKLLGDAVYDQDSWLPQIAVGAQYKINDRKAVLAAIGAQDNQGYDFYMSATKLFLRESFLLNTTLRATKANQMGLLGFGGPLNDNYKPEAEISGAFLLNRKTAIGAEYRMKPDNLGFAHEDDWSDFFVAWFVNKNVSLTSAYVDLGSIATRNDQRGLYLSLQAGF